MRRFNQSLIAIAALTLLLATRVMAADPGPTVDSVVAVEYASGVFAAAVLAHGPEPLGDAQLLVNDSPVVPDRVDHIVLRPARNLTLFKFTVFGPETVVDPGDEVTAVVTDMQGNTAEKTVRCAQGRVFRQLVLCH